MPRDPLIGLVGKPSSGKSTTLNSLTDANSKTGNFPFTTIDPNRAIGFLRVACACSRFGLEAKCAPNYGSCDKGRRAVPIELIDVAGLVPGAHEGRGLGNKFLDDLRKADGLVIVVDVSGTTDAEGKETRGYDPSEDVRWLRGEIGRWVMGNLMEKWGSIKRRHVAVKATPVETLQNQFSGYGATPSLTARALHRSGIKEPLESWSNATVEKLVDAFLEEKFPFVIALNKIDHPDADKNIAKLAKMYPADRIVLTSAISEVFLRKLAKQGYVKYTEGTEIVDTYEDFVEQGEEDGGGLKPMDEKLKARLENMRDLVLFRFGGTGVVDVLSRAGDMLGLTPVFPVRSVQSGFGAEGKDAKVFRDCLLVKRGSTVGDVFRKVMGDVPLAYVETVGGIRVSEDDVLTPGKNDILSFKVGRA